MVWRISLSLYEILKRRQLDMTFSVIIPVYNVEQYLGRCVDSVIKQTYQDFEIILIDDGSTDNSGALCEKYAAMDSRIRAYHQKNAGLSAARNAGIAKSNGEYILFLDSDDYWLNDEALSHIYEQVVRKPDIVVFGVSIVGDELAQKMYSHCINLNRLFPKEFLSGKEYLTSVLKLDCGYLWWAIRYAYRRELWENERFPVGKKYEDVFTTYKILLKARMVKILPEDIYAYIIGRVGQITQSVSFEAWNNRFEASVENIKLIENYPISEDLKKLLCSNMAEGYYESLIKLTMLSSVAEQKECLKKLEAEKRIAHYTATVKQKIAYGMISDTMNFNSPTCTTIDRNLAKRLSSEYDIDFDAMAKELFENTATIRGKEFKNILYNDVKEYMLSGYHIAVSQVFTFDLSIVDEIKEDFLKYMDEIGRAHV